MTQDNRQNQTIDLTKEDGKWQIKKPEKKIPYTHIILFVLTFITTTFAGASFSGKDPASVNFLSGLPFSLSLLTILLFHEFGHYIMSHRHDVEATLPYFIPAPSFIGTFGAIIKMKSRLRSKSALIDIGAAGPLAGFFILLPFLFYGIAHSEIIPKPEGGILLGDSMLMKVVTYITWGPLPEGYDLMLHPVAFAAWIGSFVTAMNLIPIGQLDGGHIAYALFTKRFRRISFLSLVALALLGYKAWEGWFIWAVLLLVLGRSHPPVENEEEELPRSKKLLGLFAFFVFIITFIPSPFKSF